MRSESGHGAKVFIDTGAFGAITLFDDEHHHDAHAMLQRLTEQRWRFFTTNFVVAETHALILTRAGRTAAREAIRIIDQGSTTIVRVSEDDERQARTILARYRDKDFSLVDAMSFAVMARLGISAAFAFDRHFMQDGFALVDAP